MNCLQLTLIQIVPILLSTENISSRSVYNARETALRLLFITIIAFVVTIKSFAEAGFHFGISDLPWAKLIVCFVLVIITSLAFARSNVLKKQYDEQRGSTWMDEITEGEPQTHFGQIE